MADPYAPACSAGRSRGIEAIRAGWGAVLLFAPRAVLAAALRSRADRRAIVIARILGARHLTQATLSGLRPTPAVLAMGVWVDAVHAATALALGAGDRHRVRAALIDALVAAGWAAAGYRDLAPDSPVGATTSGPSRQRRRDLLARAVLGVAPGGRALLARADRVNRASTYEKSTRATAVPAGASRTDQGRTPA